MSDSLFNFEPYRPPGSQVKKPFLPWHIRMGYKMALLGATNEQIADAFDINPDTLYQWMREHTELAEAITRGKVEADANIVHSLYKIAKGYRYKEHKKGFSKVNGAYAEEIEKEMPPDFKAISFWLRNRHPALWRQMNNDNVIPLKGGEGAVKHYVDWEEAPGCEPINENFDGTEPPPDTTP